MIKAIGEQCVGIASPFRREFNVCICVGGMFFAFPYISLIL